MNSKLVFLFASLLIGAVVCDDDQCPQLDAVDNFQAARYIGKWYELYRLDNEFEAGQQCVTAEYSLNADGSVKVNNTGYLAAEGNKRVNAIGKAVLVSEGKGLFSVSFDGEPSKDSPNYKVLATDYDRYTVVHTCYYGPLAPGAANQKVQFGWVLTREKNPVLTDEDRGNLQALLKVLNVKQGDVIQTAQNCDN